jgi:putative transposase
LSPPQEEFLRSCVAASRFWFNHGLALVKERLDRRARGEAVSVPWSYHALCSELDLAWRAAVAPWQREVVCGSYQAGFEALGSALQRFSQERRAGRRVGFPRFRRKDGAQAESVIFQRPRIIDSRHVEFDRRTGPVRAKERLSKLIRLLKQDPHARVLRSTVSRRGGKWYVSFTVERSPKARRARRPNAALGVDVGLAHLATLSTGEQVANSRPLGAALRKLRRLQRQLDRQRRAANPENYLSDGRARRGARDWVSSARMRRTHERIRRLHARVANLRREQAHRLTTRLTREFGVIGVEDLYLPGLLRNRWLARHIADAGWGEILRQLSYKASWAGSTVVAVDRYYPSSKTCSACGTAKAKLSLPERVFACRVCCLVIDRDLNAAINLAVTAQQHAHAEGNEQCYVARTGRERENARRGQVRPFASDGRSPMKREDSSESSWRREAPAVATA